MWHALVMTLKQTACPKIQMYCPLCGLARNFGENFVKRYGNDAWMLKRNRLITQKMRTIQANIQLPDKGPIETRAFYKNDNFSQ